MKNSPKVTPIVVNGEIIGFNLQADFTAEHEWGINDLKSSLNIDSTSIEEYLNDDSRTDPIPTGLRVNKNSSKLQLSSDGTRHYLTTSNYTHEHMDRCIYSSDIGGCWNEIDFAIKITSREVGIDPLDKLREAEKNNDLFVGWIDAFDVSGLKILVASKIPSDIAEEYKKQMEAAIDLFREVKETGIMDIIKESDKRYFALSPKYWDEDGKRVLKFWLNPEKQHLYNFGWYTVDDLLQWTNNEGPVIKNDED